MQDEVPQSLDQRMSRRPPWQPMVLERAYRPTHRQTMLIGTTIGRGGRALHPADSSRSWDHHFLLQTALPEACLGLTDQPVAALLADLKERGMLDDTLVIWAGEFGRTPYVQSGTV